MKAFLRKNYCTVYKEGNSEYNNINNIVLIIDHVKIVSRVEDMIHFFYSHSGRAVYLPP
jgi:hypothetical protein